MNAHQEIEQQANLMLQQLYLEKANQIHNYYQRRKGDETLQFGFASVGFPDEDIDIDQIFQIIQPGFLFEVIVTNKNSKRGRLEVILQKFLSFCDKCQSSQCKQKYGDFSQFKQKKHLLESLNQINNMRIRGVIYESEVIEDFSIFNYYINYDKIVVGDHLNAVLLDKQSMTFTLKNKSILGAKQWSLENLQSPSTFDNQLCFRLGYSKSIGLNFQMSQLNKEEQEKLKRRHRNPENGLPNKIRQLVLEQIKLQSNAKITRDQLDFVVHKQEQLKIIHGNEFRPQKALSNLSAVPNAQQYVRKNHSQSHRE